MKPTPEQIKNYWNEHDTLRGIRTVKTKKRMDKLNKRLTEPLFTESWRAIIDKISEMPWYQKKQSGWDAAFDWLIRNDTNYVMIFEKGPALTCFGCGRVGNLKRNKYTKLLYCENSPVNQGCHLAAKTRGREGMVSST